MSRELEQISQNGISSLRNNHRLKRVLIAFIGFITLGSLIWWFYTSRYVRTDNAYVVADSATVSSRIPGRVVKIYVENDDSVKEGMLLLEIDPSDYALKVQQSEANLKALEEELNLRRASLSYIETTMTANVDAAKATLKIALDREHQAQKKIEEIEEKRKSAEADLKQAEKDFRRFGALYDQRAISERELDRTRTAYKKALAQYEALSAELASARIALSSAKKETERAQAQLRAAEAQDLQAQMERHRIKNLEAQVEKAKAELELAKLQLSYCKIFAPISGYVAQRRFQVGDWIQTGQPLLAIVPLHEVYVEANFKETQLKNMRIGQRAEIRADVYPRYVYKGRVIGIRAGTGAAFSLLPPENATGNWIKVVQRVPVKIALDEPPPSEYPLRVGLSLEVKVYTSDRSGSKLKEER
ncbi:MAG: HlyD family secretion protein [Syntrophobacterales bacterium]|nr:HlyD family secretion protein [Syntrophobacterales bacterium]